MVFGISVALQSIANMGCAPKETNTKVTAKSVQDAGLWDGNQVGLTHEEIGERYYANAQRRLERRQWSDSLELIHELKMAKQFLPDLSEEVDALLSKERHRIEEEMGGPMTQEELEMIGALFIPPRINVSSLRILSALEDDPETARTLGTAATITIDRMNAAMTQEQ